jgi:hypothetical protein
LNPTPVRSIYQVRTEEDIVKVLREGRWSKRTFLQLHSTVTAEALGCRVSVRGTKHSMGGHSIAKVHAPHRIALHIAPCMAFTLPKDGIVIDMGFIRHMRYDRERNLVVVGAGAHWSGKSFMNSSMLS